MRQAAWAGNISVVVRHFLKCKRRMGKEKNNVSAPEENKAIFRRYAEEVGNQHNFEIVDEIFERYIAHQPDGSTLVRGPQDVKRFQGGGVSLSFLQLSHQHRGPDRRRGQGGEPLYDRRHPPGRFQGHGANRQGDRDQGSHYLPLLP